MSTKFEINIDIKNYKNEITNYKHTTDSEEEAYKIFEEKFDELNGKLDVDTQVAALITLDEIIDGETTRLMSDEFSTYTINLIEHMNNQRTDREYRYNTYTEACEQFIKIAKTIVPIENVEVEGFVEQHFMYNKPMVCDEFVCKKIEK